MRREIVGRLLGDYPLPFPLNIYPIIPFVEHGQLFNNCVLR